MKERLAGMDWEVASRVYGATKIPLVTVNLKTKKVSFTKSAYELAGSPEAVTILYSRKHKSIGFRASTLHDSSAVCVTECGARGCRMSAARLANMMIADGFLGTLVAPAQWHSDGLLWADLTMATKFRRKPAQTKGGKTP